MRDFGVVFPSGLIVSDKKGKSHTYLYETMETWGGDGEEGHFTVKINDEKPMLFECAGDVAVEITDAMTRHAQALAKTMKAKRKAEKKCPHGRQKRICKECGGSRICAHGRRKHRCKECSSIRPKREEIAASSASDSGTDNDGVGDKGRAVCPWFYRMQQLPPEPEVVGNEPGQSSFEFGSIINIVGTDRYGYIAILENTFGSTLGAVN